MPFISPTFKNISEEAIQKHDIDAESHALLDKGHTEILQSECYEDYGVTSYIERFMLHYD